MNCQLIDDLSALGLRHVGYGVPTEMFAPFAPASALGEGSSQDGALLGSTW